MLPGDIVLLKGKGTQVGNRGQLGCAMTLLTQNGVNGSGLSTEEPCAGKPSRTVRERRRGGRPPRRPRLGCPKQLTMLHQNVCMQDPVHFLRRRKETLVPRWF